MITSQKAYIVFLFVVLFVLIAILIRQRNKSLESYKIKNMKIYVLNLIGSSFNSKLFSEENIRKKTGLAVGKCVFENLKIPLDITPQEWALIGKQIDENYDKYDSFVIIHPTSDVTYTASALSFELENLNKSVILIGESSSKKLEKNVINSLLLGSYYIIPEVMICFGGKILRGNRSTKVGDSYLSPYFPKLGQIIDYKISINKKLILPRPSSGFQFIPIYHFNITILKTFPGIDVSSLLNLPKNIQGLILETHNSVFDKAFTFKLIELVREKAMSIAFISATKDSSKDDELALAGMVDGRDMTTESCYAKFLFILSTEKHYPVLQKMKILLRNPIRGEITKAKKS